MIGQFTGESAPSHAPVIQSGAEANQHSHAPWQESTWGQHASQPLHEYGSVQAHAPQPLPYQGSGYPPAYAPGPYQPVPGQFVPGHPGTPWQPVPGQFVPGQMPFYPGQSGYSQNGYPYLPYGYYGYYPWPAAPVAPKRDTYTLVVSIIAFICSLLVTLGGLVCLGLAGLIEIVPSSNLPEAARFEGSIAILAFALMGIIGGSFCIYHTIRALFFQKASHSIRLPRFWTFLLSYLVILAIGILLHSQQLDITTPPLTTVLIYLAAIFPVLTILSLGLYRLRPSKTDPLPTTWRRFTLALVSGATLSVSLAIILESILTILLAGSQSNTITTCLSDSTSCTANPSIIAILLLTVSVIAPLVEEFVKPLAVIILIGRVRSKAEAFALGLACGLGFNLIETTGYISSGYTNWLSVALERSGAGLLHGFGAAMMALGWYYLTHEKEGSGRRRILLALACGGYAILQHATWNGSIGLALLPDPIGHFFMTWSINFSGISIDAFEVINAVEVIAMLIFFLYMAGRLRGQPAQQKREGAPNVEAFSS